MRKNRFDFRPGQNVIHCASSQRLGTATIRKLGSTNSFVTPEQVLKDEGLQNQLF